MCTKVVIRNSWDCVGEEETQAQRARARRDNAGTGDDPKGRAGD